MLAATRCLYLISGPSVDDGLDEDSQVLSGLSGLVALQAEPQAGRARFVERDLVHQLLPAVLQHLTGRFLAFLEKKTKQRSEAEVLRKQATTTG